jgi:hypothetical protein
MMPSMLTTWGGGVYTTAKRTGGRAFVLVVMVAAMALATLAVFAVEARATAGPTGSFGHLPPKAVLMKYESVLQVGADVCAHWYFYQNGEWEFLIPTDYLGCYSPPKADEVGAGRRLHVRLAKPERPSVRILAFPKLNERTGKPSGQRRVLKDTLRPVKRDGETVGWEAFFRVNEPERQYYLKVSAAWERVPGEHVSYGHAIYDFHIETR